MSREGWTFANMLSPTCHVWTVISENANPSLVSQGYVGDKPCLITMDTRAYVTGEARHCHWIAWKTIEPMSQVPDGAWGSPSPSWNTSLKFSFWRSISNGFNLGMNILCTCDSTVDMGHETLCLAGEEVSL
jgi:hypothetical protein